MSLGHGLECPSPSLVSPRDSVLPCRGRFETACRAYGQTAGVFCWNERQSTSAETGRPEAWGFQGGPAPACTWGFLGRAPLPPRPVSGRRTRPPSGTWRAVASAARPTEGLAIPDRPVGPPPCPSGRTQTRHACFFLLLLLCLCSTRAPTCDHTDAPCLFLSFFFFYVFVLLALPLAITQTRHARFFLSSSSSMFLFYSRSHLRSHRRAMPVSFFLLLLCFCSTRAPTCDASCCRRRSERRTTKAGPRAAVTLCRGLCAHGASRSGARLP